MFKEENRIWWYLLGTIILMVLFVLFGINVFVPWIRGDAAVSDIRIPYTEAPPFTIDTSQDYTATIQTNFGVIQINLFESAAPQNVNSLVFLAQEDYYNGTRFHRLIPNLLIQGGDHLSADNNPDNDGFGNPGYFIPDEVNWDALNLSEQRREQLRSRGYENSPRLPSRSLARGRVAMASNGPNTNGEQFFIVLANESDQRLQAMQGYYTVVGEVTGGLDTLNELGDVPVDDPNTNVPRPVVEIVIESIQISTN